MDRFKPRELLTKRGLSHMHPPAREAAEIDDAMGLARWPASSAGSSRSIHKLYEYEHPKGLFSISLFNRLKGRVLEEGAAAVTMRPSPMRA